jgi:ankyrin repeat protein
MPRSFCGQASLLDQVGVDLLTPLHWAARKGHEEVRRPYLYVIALCLRGPIPIDKRYIGKTMGNVGCVEVSPPRLAVHFRAHEALPTKIGSGHLSPSISIGPSRPKPLALFPLKWLVSKGGGDAAASRCAD